MFPSHLPSDQGNIQTQRVAFYTPTAPTHAGLVSKVAEWNYIQLAQSTFFICVGNYFWLSHLTHPVQVHLDFKTLGSTGKSFWQWKEVWCKRKDSTLRIKRLGVWPWASHQVSLEWTFPIRCWLDVFKVFLRASTYVLYENQTVSLHVRSMVPHGISACMWRANYPLNHMAHYTVSPFVTLLHCHGLCLWLNSLKQIGNLCLGIKSIEKILFHKIQWVVIKSMWLVTKTCLPYSFTSSDS